MKGRDPIFKCDVCGKFISYDDIPGKVKTEFILDSEYTTETTSFTHLHCLNMRVYLPKQIMKKELKSGIIEFDNLVEQFENGEINFVALADRLWNGGYCAGKEDLLVELQSCNKDEEKLR